MFGRKTVGYNVERTYEPCEPELDCHTLVEPAIDPETFQPLVFSTPSAAQEYINTHAVIGLKQEVVPIKK